MSRSAAPNPTSRHTPTVVFRHCRRLLASDWLRWRALFQAYLDFYAQELSPQVIAATWTRLLHGRNDGLSAWIAADTSDRTIGLAYLVYHPSTWSESSYCYLEDLFVDAAARGLYDRFAQVTDFVQYRVRGGAAHA